MNKRLINKYIDLFKSTYGLSDKVCGRVNLDTTDFITTRDGRTILDWCRQIRTTNKEEILLQALLSKASKEMEKHVGDGTTTTMLILLYLLKQNKDIADCFMSLNSTPKTIGEKPVGLKIMDLLSKTTHIQEVKQLLRNDDWLYNCMNCKNELIIVKGDEDWKRRGVFLKNLQTTIKEQEYHIFAYDKTFEDYSESAKISSLMNDKIPCLVVAPNINYNIEQKFMEHKGSGLFSYIKMDTVGVQKIQTYSLLKQITKAMVFQTTRGLLLSDGSTGTHAVCSVATNVNDFEFETNIDDVETFYHFMLENDIRVANAVVVYNQFYNLFKDNNISFVFNKMNKLAYNETNYVCVNTIAEATKTAISVYNSYKQSASILFYKPNIQN